MYLKKFENIQIIFLNTFSTGVLWILWSVLMLFLVYICILKSFVNLHSKELFWIVLIVGRIFLKKNVNNFLKLFWTNIQIMNLKLMKFKDEQKLKR